uniref:HIT-type domain-containing protein n=1 Tax=Glossina austeni TaxID=7395 RepID=A0A1A9UF85_GLOAU
MAGGRESYRIKDAEKQRVLDAAARQRHPHADLVMSKKLPKFQDGLKNTKEKKSKRKGPEYYRAKYRKNFQQLLEEEKQLHPDPPNYISALALPPKTPQRHFCAVCGNFSKYSCTACGTRYCCIRCLRTITDFAI